MDPLQAIGVISGSGMRAQAERMRVVSENIANANVTGTTPGADPYQRQVITFSEMLDRNTGVNRVTVDRIVPDMSDFKVRFDPSHPAADAEGFVKLPNVEPLIEMNNMREASRSYEANMNMFDIARQMKMKTIDMLR